MVTYKYAREVEGRVNTLLAEGKVAEARMQALNITGGGPGAQNVQRRVFEYVNAASNQEQAVRNAEEARRRAEEGGGGPPPPPGGGGGGGTTGSTAEDLYYDALRADLAARRAAEREGAKSFLRGLLETYGLSSLSGEVDRLVGETTNELVIAQRLRETQQYKDRFKGLLGLQQRGVTDIRNEAEYLNLESQYRQVFREAGLRDYLGTSGTQSEYDSIAKIVGDFSLSVNEVRDRVTDAQRVVAETPQEVRDSLQRFYGIDPSLLTQYVLDPENTTTEIQRRANAAIVGGYAERAGLEFGAGVSERIGEFLGGERDIRGTQIEPQLTEIADIQRSTQRLAEIEQGDLSAETSALSALNLDEGARRRVRTLQSRERARFGGRSAITTGSLSEGPSI